MDSYIGTEVLRPFLGTCVLFFFLFFMFQTFRLADFLIIHKVPAPMVAKISLYLLVSFSPMVLPVAFLAAVLVGFGRLSGESETVAFKSSGFSLLRMTAPVVALSVGVSLLSLMLAFEWAPSAERAMSESMMRVASSHVSTALKEKTFNVGFYDLLLYADEIVPDTGLMKRVFIYDERESAYPVVVVARTGQIRNLANRDKGLLNNQVILTLSEGKIYKIDPLAQSSSTIGFRDYSLYLRVNEGEVGDPNRPRMWSTRMLLDRMNRVARNGGEYAEYATEFWKRMWSSLSAIVFAFLGVGLGVVRTRAVQSRGILLTLGAVFLYWQTLVWGSGQAQNGSYAPALALALPNMVLAVPAAISFWRSSW